MERMGSQGSKFEDLGFKSARDVPWHFGFRAIGRVFAAIAELSNKVYFN